MKLVDDATFTAEVLQSDLPVLVDFFAPWCAPCTAAVPVLEQMEKTFPTVKIVKVNVDTSPKTASQFGVKALPTFLLFKGGKVAKMFAGAGFKARVEEALKAI